MYNSLDAQNFVVVLEVFEAHQIVGHTMHVHMHALEFFEMWTFAPTDKYIGGYRCGP